MQLSDNEIKTGGLVATWVLTVCGFVWRTSKFHSRVEQVEKEVLAIKRGNFLTTGDHETRQLLCRKDVDNELHNNAHAVKQVAETQAAISQDIKQLADVVIDMDKKVAVIFAKVNRP